MQVEFQCDARGTQDWDKIRDVVHKLSGANEIRVDPDSQSLTVRLSHESVVGINELQDGIESSTGIKTVLKGLGTGAAAVTELKGGDGIVGVVRLVQVSDGSCFLDGAVSGLPDRRLSINVHQFGDLTDSTFETIGPPVVSLVAGLECKTPGYSSFRKQVPDCDLMSCIGRTLAVSDSTAVLAAGIVARASSVGHNLTKKVCDCSGKSLWEERTESKMRTSF